MPQSLVLIVRSSFQYQGRQVEAGEMVKDADEIAWLRANHPEKVVATMQEDDPAPEASPEPEQLDLHEVLAHAHDEPVHADKA